jgi:hypothetical protein
MVCAGCGASVPLKGTVCLSCGRPLQTEIVAAATPEQMTVAPDAATVMPEPAGRTPAHERSSSAGWLSSADSISHGRFAPGAILDNRFRLIGLLGKGGMGEVYRADDLRLGQPVALKFLPAAVAHDAARLAQIHNEVRTARQISHPNLCRVYNIGEAEGQLFLSMEYVDGEDLASSLRRIGRFAEDKALDISRQLCAGLAAAHERGVLHRDLKPANIMLDGAGRVRIMDFGLATDTPAGNVRAGTPAYMAPEQLLGHDVTVASDVYALGLILYELFTGQRPFKAATLNELVEQHQSGSIPPPSTYVSALDPGIERAILRCLQPDPARRPSSALAVAAALPGGDPLAAALAAGETPSPAMVAAAGEGAGLSHRVAAGLLIAALVGVAAAFVIALGAIPLDRMRLEYGAPVLLQKARDAVRQLGYAERPYDEAYGFARDTDLVRFVEREEREPDWESVLGHSPSPLTFWYRRSPQAMTGLMFHHDLLTPGIVTLDDPPATTSGMLQLRLDRHGLLTYFEAVPPQVVETPASESELPWPGMLQLAGFDPAQLQPTSPHWTWMSSADTRAAWTGTAPGDSRAVRVEAASLGGRPVGFLVVRLWTTPWRNPSGGTVQDTVFAVIVFGVVFLILGVGTALARRNLRDGRGDRTGALTLGASVTLLLIALWVCQVHLSASVGLAAMFLLVVCTSVFYGVFFWALYLAIEPFVRRYWPQTLVSWTTILAGRARDPIVGRDVLYGVLLGVATNVLMGSAQLLSASPGAPPVELLHGMRATVGQVLMQPLYAVRGAFFIFFLMFVVRVLLRSQWAAVVAVVIIFSLLSGLDSDDPWLVTVLTAIVYTMFAGAVVRWGLTSLAVAVMVANLLLMIPATTDWSAPFVAQMLLVMSVPVALAVWAFRAATARRPWSTDPRIT